jgi:hypothetical protein
VLAANIKTALEELENVGKVHLRIMDFVRADEINEMMEES